THTYTHRHTHTLTFAHLMSTVGCNYYLRSIRFSPSIYLSLVSSTRSPAEPFSSPSTSPLPPRPRPPPPPPSPPPRPSRKLPNSNQPASLRALSAFFLA